LQVNEQTCLWIRHRWQGLFAYRKEVADRALLVLKYSRNLTNPWQTPNICRGASRYGASTEGEGLRLAPARSSPPRR
jgi:hypothetical protein